MLKTITLIIIFLSVKSQYCINNQGQPTEWWTILKTPPKIGNNGFAYYDSRSKTGKFKYMESQVDGDSSALKKTIDQFNSDKFQLIAWNDEKPSGSTSSTSAHSKGFIAFSVANKIGFFISHSIPKYPIVQGKKINPQIQPQQQVYGQHIICLSLGLKQLDNIAAKLLIIRPLIYTDPVTSSSSIPNLYQLSIHQFPQTTQLFQIYDLRSVYGYGVKSIFKHHSMNGSIFEDGLTDYLSVSPIIAETWGRPLQPAWCSGSFTVKNVVQIQIEDYTWYEADDHSKWLLANDVFVCFGDMNRMNSQWKRGGAYYCFTNVDLIEAVKKIIVSTDSC